MLFLKPQSLLHKNTIQKSRNPSGLGAMICAGNKNKLVALEEPLVQKIRKVPPAINRIRISVNFMHLLIF